MADRRGKDEGNIKKREDGRWEARFYLTDGRRKSVYARTRQEVVRRMREILQQEAEGLAALDERRTLRQYLESWLESVRYQIRPSTWRRYENFVRLYILPQLGRVVLSKLTAQQVQQFYTKVLQTGLSPTTVNHLHGALHRALEDALRLGLVHYNVTAKVRPPRRLHHEMCILSAEQARVLLASVVGDRFEALYLLALSTGMREGELFALRWQDVDLARQTLQVRMGIQEVQEGGKKKFICAETKTSYSRRRIGLTRRVVEALKQHRGRQEDERERVGVLWETAFDLVFPNTLGGLVIPKNFVKRNFKRKLHEAGLPEIRFHDLRHTAATLMLSRGVNVKVVSEMLGHADISITLRIYAHVLPHMQHSAVQAMESLLGFGEDQVEQETPEGDPGGGKKNENGGQNGGQRAE